MRLGNLIKLGRIEEHEGTYLSVKQALVAEGCRQEILNIEVVPNGQMHGSPCPTGELSAKETCC
jgi:hypothetical protein